MAWTGRVIVCRFSGALADLPKGKRTILDALQALEKHPLVSTFDRGELPWMNRLLGELLHQGLILELKEEYPWHRYELMTAGRQMLAGLRNQPNNPMAHGPAEPECRRGASRGKLTVPRQMCQTVNPNNKGPEGPFVMSIRYRPATPATRTQATPASPL